MFYEQKMENKLRIPGKNNLYYREKEDWKENMKYCERETLL